MNTKDSVGAYRQSTAFGASAVGQVMALYDTILRDLHRALDAVEAGKIEERVNSTNHALVVIGELQGVLDFERGGEAARNLSNFYNVTRSMIAHASMTSSREKFQELISMFARIRAAWSKVEKTVAPCSPPGRLRGSSEQQPVFSHSAAEPATVSSSSNGAGWKA
ncbi:MAG: flagellar protein FliS [Candidatus Acidiferrum sp.]|jgi:flagellar protein FliS